MRTPHCHIWLVLVSMLSGAVGCTPDFDEVWQVKDLRILALRADPPEILGSIEEAIPAVHVDGLIVDPRGPDELFFWEFWVCTPEELSCDKARQQHLVKEGHTPLSEISMDYYLDRELLLASIEADVLKGFGGVPVMVELRVSRGEYSARAIKRLAYGTVTPPEKKPNHNPSLQRIMADDQDVTPPLMVATEKEVKLLPEASAESKEDYVVTTFTGGSRSLTEYLTYSFYATSGTISNASTGGKPSPFVTKNTVTDLSSGWSPDPLVEAATLWIVIQDDRGGVGWTTLPAKIQPN
jgi:hypothetical protein